MKFSEDIELVKRLDQLIRLKATGTPKELAKRLGKSESTIYRLIDSMRCLGFPIIYDKQRRSYRYEKEVRFSFEVCVLEGQEKSNTVGGKNFSFFDDFFSPLSFFDSGMGFLCGR
ncbi:MAG TPA: HTH domain-containing protein [Bacteroidetes bacterium]|nr:HTH domain-containing protein [Bacteroidota bacterium]